MSSVTNISHIVAMIRREITPAVGAAAARRTRAVKARTAGNGVRGKREGGADVMSLVQQRVRALDRADPDCGRKAFHLFLETVLLHELGEQLINDAGFYDLVEQVHCKLEAEPALAEAMSLATRHLLGEVTLSATVRGLE